MIPVLSLFAILENFEFLVGQKDTYLKDIHFNIEEDVIILIVWPVREFH